MRFREPLVCVTLTLVVVVVSASAALAARPGTAAFRGRVGAFLRPPVTPAGVLVMAPVSVSPPNVPEFFMRPPLSGIFRFGYPLPGRASMSVRYVSPTTGTRYRLRTVIQLPVPVNAPARAPDHTIKKRGIEQKRIEPSSDSSPEQFNPSPASELQSVAPPADVPTETVPAPEVLPQPDAKDPGSPAKPKNEPTPTVRPNAA